MKTILYVGLNDKETRRQAIETDEALEIVSNLLINDYSLPGATLQVAKGIYKHEDGKVVKENTIVIILLDIEDSIINKIIEDLKNIFNQESILKEISEVKYSFM